MNLGNNIFGFGPRKKKANNGCVPIKCAVNNHDPQRINYSVPVSNCVPEKLYLCTRYIYFSLKKFKLAPKGLHSYYGDSID